MIISANISKVLTYVPEFNGNSKLSGSDQIIVTYKSPTVDTKEKLFPKKFEINAEGEVKSTLEIDREATLKEFIVKIENLAYQGIGESQGKVVSVKTASDLFKAPVEFDELIDELYNLFNGILNTKVSEKN